MSFNYWLIKTRKYEQLFKQIYDLLRDSPNVPGGRFGLQNQQPFRSELEDSKEVSFYE